MKLCLLCRCPAFVSAEQKVANETTHSRLPVSLKFWTTNFRWGISAVPIIVHFSGSILHDHFISFPLSSNLQHLLSNSYSQLLNEIVSYFTVKTEENFHNLPPTQLLT